MSLRFAAMEALRLREFDDGVIVFDPASWDAHLLNPAAAAILEMCMARPSSLQDIEVFLAQALSEEERSSACDHAERLLGELAELGLVRVDESNAPE
jgi:PqqD family protein of HPr-rel-A system